MFIVQFADGSRIKIPAATAEQARGRAYRLSYEPIVSVAAV